LPTAARDGLLSKPEELVGRLAIREAMAEVISRSMVAITKAASFGYGGPSLWQPFAIADPNPAL